MNPHYARVAQRAAHRCEYCQAPEAVFNFPFEVEHIVPPGLGGTDEDFNLALSCRACNLYKANHLEALDPQTKVPAQLFDPRRQRWSDHFRFIEKSAIMEGLTPLGRATIEQLQMNRPPQVEARKQWTRLKLFPSD